MPTCIESFRWPDGFVCPRCEHAKGHRLPPRPRLQQCAVCRHQVSVTAGTVFHRTKLPLTTWFRGIYPLSQSKNGVSGLELSRRLGVRYNIAWMLKYKLMHVMKKREAGKQLLHRIEMDGAYLGGDKASKPGEARRGSPNETPFVIAMEADESGHPKRIAIRVVDGLTLAEIGDFAGRKLVSSCEVYSDGLSCLPGLIPACCSHSVHLNGVGRNFTEAPTFE